MSNRALVWFKRDLRLADHAPLAAAAGFEQALALVVLEPDWLASPECDSRHIAFWLATVEDLQQRLATRGLPLLLRIGPLPEVLQHLRRQYPFTHLLSHEETGPGWSYDRDRAVAQWCRHQGVAWQEWPQTGVVRRLQQRNGWAQRWARRMQAPLVPTPAAFRAPQGWEPSLLPTLADLGRPAARSGNPAAGEVAAWDTLHDFLGGRGRAYRGGISSPLSAPGACSRLSPHLAFGTLSMRQVHQATEAAIAGCGPAPDERALASGLRAFSARLRWHCHFMQKLEDEPALEFRNLARSTDGLRPGDGVHPEPLDSERLQAWCEGRTGFPMVDACMRQLNATGWLNFRMRAMLVSFAAYHLGLHWREPGLHLARQFLDFEAGIHWSQMQMQSGTTGINTLRVYSPAKQQRDHDPDGRYLRQWLPEFGTPAYPAPLVDEAQALRDIKARLHARRQAPDARAEADAIQDKHGSRKSGLPATGRGARAGGAGKRRAAAMDERQGKLF